MIHTGGSTFDTLLGVYTGQEMEALVPVASHDGDGVSSYVSFPVTEGLQYQIAVDGFGVASGIIVLSWELLGECTTPSKPVGPMPPDGTQGADETVKLEWDRTAARLQNVIYGEDDRLDLFEVEDAALVRAAESTVALVLIEDLTDNGDGTFSIPRERVGENKRLCPDERFANQPNPASCTGFLVAPDLIATAGHCLKTTTDCASYAFVFGFRMTGPDEPVLTFPRSQVYFCDGILGREFEADYDWAVVRLDRPVLDHEPLEIRRDGVIRGRGGRRRHRASDGLARQDRWRRQGSRERPRRLLHGEPGRLRRQLGLPGAERRHSCRGRDSGGRRGGLRVQPRRQLLAIQDVSRRGMSRRGGHALHGVRRASGCESVPHDLPGVPGPLRMVALRSLYSRARPVRRSGP